MLHSVSLRWCWIWENLQYTQYASELWEHDVCFAQQHELIHGFRAVTTGVCFLQGCIADAMRFSSTGTSSQHRKLGKETLCENADGLRCGIDR